MIDCNTKLITVDIPQDATNMRKMFVANALSVVGTKASNPNTYNKFEKLLGPTISYWDLKRPFRVYHKNGKLQTEGVSTCGLVARGIWRRMGVDMPKIYKNYNFGMAMIDEQNFCKSLKPKSAWHTPVKDDGILPLPGDYIIIGSGLMTHNITCVGFDGDNLVSVDGGRVETKTRLQEIEKVERKIVYKDGYPYLQDQYFTRKIVGWAMIDLLPYKKEALVPEGWEQVSV